MSQYKYIDFYYSAAEGRIVERDISNIVQNSNNTIIRFISDDLVADSVFFSILQADGDPLSKKLALLQPTLLDGAKVWQYRLTESDTAIAPNPEPMPMEITIGIKQGDITDNLDAIETVYIERSNKASVVVPSESSLDGISDGFNAVSAEILRLDNLRSSGITGIVDNGDGTLTITWEDGTLLTSNLTGPQGPIGPAGPAGEAGTTYIHPTYTSRTINTTGNTIIGGFTSDSQGHVTGISTRTLDSYVHPTYTGRSITATGVDVLSIFTSDSLGHVTGITTRTLPNASTTLPGVMTAADKVKLDGIATNANNYTHPTFTAVSIDTDGFEVLDTLTTNTDGHVTTATKRALPTITVAKGGTGLTTLNSGQALIGNGTGSLNFKVITDSEGASAIGQGTSLVTERDIYYGLPFINGDHTYTSATTFFSPTSAGVAGYTLKSAGVGAPFWDVANNHTHGIITSNGFTTEGVANRALTTTTSGQITTTEVITTGTGAITGSNALLTAQRIFNGLSWVNNQRQSSDISRDIWAPTTGGTSGQILKSNGTSAPSWIDAPGLVQFGLNTTHIRTLTGAATDMIGSDTGHPFTINVAAYKGILFKFCRRFGTSPNFTWICDYAVVPNNPNDSGINISFDVNDSIILTSSKELRRGDLQTFNQTFATIVRTSTSNTSLSLTARMSYCNNEDEIRIYGIS